MTYFGGISKSRRRKKGSAASADADRDVCRTVPVVLRTPFSACGGMADGTACEARFRPSVRAFAPPAWWPSSSCSFDCCGIGGATSSCGLPFRLAARYGLSFHGEKRGSSVREAFAPRRCPPSSCSFDCCGIVTLRRPDSVSPGGGMADGFSCEKARLVRREGLHFPVQALLVLLFFDCCGIGAGCVVLRTPVLTPMAVWRTAFPRSARLVRP